MATFLRTIAPDELTRLQDLAAVDDPVTSRRARCVLLSAEGKTTTEIGEQIGTSERTVRNVVVAFSTRGTDSLAKAVATGRPRRLRSVATEVLRETISASPKEYGFGMDYWSLDALAQALGEKLGMDDLRADISLGHFAAYDRLGKGVDHDIDHRSSGKFRQNTVHSFLNSPLESFYYNHIIRCLFVNRCLHWALELDDALIHPDEGVATIVLPQMESSAVWIRRQKAPSQLRPVLLVDRFGDFELVVTRADGERLPSGQICLLRSSPKTPNN
jgi:transposase